MPKFDIQSYHQLKRRNFQNFLILSTHYILGSPKTLINNVSIFLHFDLKSITDIKISNLLIIYALFQYLFNVYNTHLIHITMFFKNSYKTPQYLSPLEIQIDKLSQRLIFEINKIEVALEKNLNNNQMEMSVIFQEESERSFGGEENEEREGINAGRTLQKFSSENCVKLRKIDEKLEKLLKIYSDELYSLCQDVTKWESKNQEIKRKYKQLKSKFSEMSAQNEELKDQITTLSSEYLVNAHSSTQQFDNLFQQAKPPKQSNKCKIINKYQPQEKPQSKQNIPSNNQYQQQKFLQQQQKKNTQKWKQLSKKLNDLKQKLYTYEEQIAQKDSKIKSLTDNLKRKEQAHLEDEEKKKLKKSNTTLRGEKTVLNNQIAALKKTICDKNQLCEIYEKEIEGYKAEMGSFQETIRFQEDLIKDLKYEIARKEEQEGLIKSRDEHETERCRKYEVSFYEFLSEQENTLQEFQKHLDKIQEKYEIKIKGKEQEIEDLRTILDEKNQTIFKMKTQTRTQDKTITQQRPPAHDNAYYLQLVKNLTKKIAQKDDIIRQLTNNS